MHTFFMFCLGGIEMEVFLMQPQVLVMDEWFSNTAWLGLRLL